MTRAGIAVAAGWAALTLAGCGDDEAPRAETVTVTRTVGTAPQGPERPARRAEFYAPDSIWNTPIPADAPRDPRSDTYVDELVRQVDRDRATVLFREYSVPIYRVGADQRRVRVRLTKRAPALQEAFASVPLPDDPRPADGTDGALLVYQRATDTIWEFWRFRQRAGEYEADWGGRMTEVSKNPGYYRWRETPVVEKPFWGFNVTRIGGATGIMTLDELRRGRIDHVLYLAIPDARKGICAAPASGTDGVTDSPDAIPEGARFRLDPDLDVEALDVPAMTKVMARAAQRYGVVVGNRAGAVNFAAEDPAQYGGDPYAEIRDGASPMEIAEAFPFERLQTLKLDLRRC
ncbi:MAG: hypothetical protein ACEQSX_00690 [Baekduiaceae bacterium]